MTTLYLLRHGALDRPQAGSYIGQMDCPLSPEGRSQAHRWRGEFQKLKLTSLWSSDLVRATETAEIIFAGRTMDLQTCRQLREIHLGEWEGVPRSRIRERHPDLWLARGRDPADFRPPGGESFRDVQQRVISKIIRIAAQTPDGSCIVTHAGVIRVAICHFLQMPLNNLFRIRPDYGSLSIVFFSPQRVEVRALNLQPPNSVFPPEGKIGGQHEPA